MGIFSTSAGDSSSPIESGKAQQLAAETASVQSKHGGARIGAGRPKGSSAAKGVGQAQPAQPGQAEKIVSEADLEFCRKITEAALKILNRVEENSIIGVINVIQDPFISERTDSFLKQREINADDIELMSNAVAACAQKYPFLSAYAPEGAILLWSTTHAMSYLNVLNELKKLALAKSAKVKGVETVAPNASSP